MMQSLYANTATLSITLEGGRHCHIGLIMKPELCITLCTTPYDSPNNPGIVPIYERNLMNQVRQDVNYKFYENKCVNKIHRNMALILINTNHKCN